MKAYRGSKNIAPFILHLGSRWSVVSLTPLTLYRLYSSNMGQVAPEEVWKLWEKNIFILSRKFEPRILQIKA
jgi:hypothetical protein